MPEIIIWGVAFIILTIIEIQTFQFVSIWFAISALITMFTAFANVPFVGQLIIFILLSAMLLIATRPFVKKHLQAKMIPTNAELDIGKPATVIEEIDNQKLTGRVRLDGVDWMARSSENEIIPLGTTVTVDRTEGAKLFVKK